MTNVNEKLVTFFCIYGNCSKPSVNFDAFCPRHIQNKPTKLGSCTYSNCNRPVYLGNVCWKHKQS